MRTRPSRSIKESRHNLLVWTLVAGVVSILVLFEVKHPPEPLRAFAELSSFKDLVAPGEFIRLWGARLAGLAAFLLFQASCFAMGRWAIGMTGGARTQGPRALLVLPLGWGLMGLIAFGLALSGLARTAVLVPLALGPGVAAWRRIAKILAALPRTLAPTNRRETTLAIVGVGTLIIAALAALAPEINADVLTCHFAKAGRILELGRYTPSHFNVQSQTPVLWEVLVAVLMATGGDAAAQWFKPWLLATIAVSIIALANEHKIRECGWTAAALFITNPFLVSQTLIAKNDLFVTAMGFAAFRWCIGATGPGAASTARCAIAGTIMGLAFLAKYTAGELWLALGAGMAVLGRARRGPMLALAIGFLVAALPGLGRNWIDTGNPVFPFAHAIMPSPWFPAVAAQRRTEGMYAPAQQDPDMVSFKTNLKILWPGRGAAETFLGWMAFLPLLLLIRKWTPLCRGSGVVLGVVFTMWMAGPPQVRYAMTTFPLGLILAAIALHGIKPKAAPGLGKIIIAGVLALQVVHVISLPVLTRALPAGAGFEAPNAYLARTLTSFYEACVGASHVPAGSRIVLHGELRLALLPPGTDFATNGPVAFAPFELIRSSRTTEEIMKRLRQQGWTHLLYNRLTAFYWRRRMADDPWNERTLALWSKFWRDHAELENESTLLDIEKGYFYLYRFVPRVQKPVRSVLPGIEGWVYLMEEDIRAEDYASFFRRLKHLKHAAGDFGIVDRIEAEMLLTRLPLKRLRLPLKHTRFLLERSIARGLRSPGTALMLAQIAEREGRRKDAERHRQEARNLEPGLVPADRQPYVIVKPSGAP